MGRIKRVKLKSEYILICIVLFTTTALAQNEYKETQGYYNLPSFEVASGIYLLENKTFFYYASFGNIDLKIYGEYNIEKDGLLTFQPDKKLMQEFNVYGTTNNIKSDSIILTYQKPYNGEFENIVVNNIEFPKFNSTENTVSININKPKSGILNINLPSAAKETNLYTIQLKNDEDEVLIFHNYYAHMVRGFISSTFTIKDEFLIYDNKKSAKQEITDKIINEVIAFIDQKRNKKTINRNEKTYKELTNTTKK
ncbi:hypothetical protein OS188_07130 [Xanthomarina sp. F1114]|uniref:hypothetical protein n=1 Tax=Xanthomarina sp. F1114 TaxID=2996019 RepID=UPI00225E4998|nr:hypothetical protein [Xanthomarina sp. F1114]MCX7547719.1 hypothetical protein [Xanthomarina sp. F1114]